VRVEDRVTGEIDQGLLVLLGAGAGDARRSATPMASTREDPERSGFADIGSFAR
jgi:D-Tyr-tRNAtyr deacylase